MKTERLKTYLLISLFLHLSLALFLRKHTPQNPSLLPPAQSTVWVIEGERSQPGLKKKKSDSRNLEAKHSEGKKPSGNIQAKKSTKAPGASGLSNLGLSPFSPREHLGDGLGNGETRSGDGYDLANGMDLTKESKLYPFFEALWKRVDTLITYPEDFIDQRIEGNVTVQLVVDEKGVFTGEIRSVHGEEPMLNTLAVATAVHALKKPLIQSQWMKEKQILLVLQFEFHLIGAGMEPRLAEQPHFKNILSFRRERHVEPKFNKTLERIFTRYIPPIIPIPGGVFIDFPHAYLYVKNLFHPEPDPDGLRQHRLEMRKEELEKLIRNSSPD